MEILSHFLLLLYFCLLEKVAHVILPPPPYELKLRSLPCGLDLPSSIIIQCSFVFFLDDHVTYSAP